MPLRRTALAVILAALSCIAAAPSHAADAGIAVSGPGGDVTLTAAVLAGLPAARITLPAGAGPGARERSFEGPLLWAVLGQAGAVDAAQHHDHVRETVILTGDDGYTAVLALGEVSPEFEGKQVILALRADGQALEAGHLRVVVPGDKRGGRGVHDVTRIAVILPRP